jgi:hypothetical protein
VFVKVPRHHQHVENGWRGGDMVLNATDATGRFDDESL